jgi:phosphatidylserine/phosphatidylglycerophosphate/cardiolipin synthase-like enzyme
VSAEDDPLFTPRFDDNPVERGVWRFAQVERASVIVDAEAYFALMQQAMLNARRRIFLVGWDFDTRIHLAKGRRWFQRPWKREYPVRLGSFLIYLARNRPGIEIRILKWTVSLLQFAVRGYMLVDIARMASKKAVTFKFDNHHPVGCSHHQKIAVLDDRLAVCGGIDMTMARWDTREHHEDDDRRVKTWGRSYGPWHDLTMMVEGPAAAHLGELSRERWYRAAGEMLQPAPPCSDSLWPEKLPVQFENVEIGISRTRAAYDDLPQVTEVEDLFLAQIARAKKFIYFENQYFTSRRVAEAIAARIGEDDPPEIVIVHPDKADGWLEQQAMDHARNCLAREIAALDHKKRFALYVPFTGETPIYVHAKLMIVDDQIVRIGSSNLNNRSLGLDSECDVFVDCARPGNAHACDAIEALRVSLLAEHCGLEEAEVARALAENPSMHALIAAHGQGRPRSLRRFDPPPVTELEATLAKSELLDPERPEDMFEPFAKGGLFREGGLARRAWRRARWKKDVG